ncbi:MAG: type II secretion system F family protein [Alphaproteobacteria bacterium]|nr:type II secretion system F family protein [Alphaproteobacteria bacterium]
MAAGNNPLQLEDVLPFGMGVDDVLTAAAAIGIFMIVWSIGQYLIVRDRFGPRLKMIQERRAELKGEMTAARRRHKGHKKHETMTVIRQVVSKLKLLQQHQVGQLQEKLINAGYRSKDAIIIFAFAKLVMPFIGLGLGLFVGHIDWSQPFTTGQAVGWLKVLGIAYFGARLPEILVANARAKRYAALRKGLPDALDLMMICAEAGLSLSAALDRVSRELSRVSPELAEEFGLTSVELGFLPDRATALRHLYDRANIPEIRGFVNVIAQTEKYGTPIAQALRVLSKEYRTQRMLRAEQKAARLPAMMTVPMIVFILPTLFIVVMAPAVISIMDNF